MTEVVYIVVPVVVVVLILKTCLICWRVWAYQQRRQRLICQRQQQARVQRAQAPAVCRVVRVERCVTDDGAFAQRTSYAVDQPGQPTRQFQRTIVIRPADNRRPNDPNLPPSYDMAVTGKDKSVKVENGPGTALPQAPPTGPPQAPPTGATPTPHPPSQAAPAHISSVSHSQMGSFRSLLPSEPPAYSGTSRTPANTQEEDEDDISSSDRARLLP